MERILQLSTVLVFPWAFWLFLLLLSLPAPSLFMKVPGCWFGHSWLLRKVRFVFPHHASLNHMPRVSNEQQAGKQIQLPTFIICFIIYNIMRNIKYLISQIARSCESRETVLRRWLQFLNWWCNVFVQVTEWKQRDSTFILHGFAIDLSGWYSEADSMRIESLSKHLWTRL